MDISWLSLWTTTVPALVVLGFVMGFSPTLYGITLHYLVQGRVGQRAVVSMMAGLAAGCTVLTILYQFVDGRVISTFISDSVRALFVQRYVDLVAGVLLLASAVILSQFKRGDRLRDWYDRTTFERARERRQDERKVRLAQRRERRKELREERRAAGKEHHTDAPRGAKDAPASVRAGFWLGVGNSYFGTSGFATMYVVSRVIDHVGPNFGVRGLAYLAFIPSLVAPYLLAAWAWRRWPRLASALSSGYTWVVGRDYYKVAVLALAVAGIVFFFMGLHGLLTG